MREKLTYATLNLLDSVEHSTQYFSDVTELEQGFGMKEDRSQ